MVAREAPFARSPIDEIKRERILRWLNAREDERDLSGPGVNRLAFLIAAVFSDCIERGDVRANPAKGIRRRQERPRKVYPGREQVDALIEHASRYVREKGVKRLEPCDDFADFLTVLAYAGLRRGELLALRWGDCDLRAGEIHLRPETVKTESSARTVPFSAPVRKALERRWKARTTADPSEPVFVQTTSRRSKGAPWSAGAVRGRWEATLQATRESKVELPESIRLHDLRTTFGSLLVNNGADMATVQRLLGHANVATTVRHYAHVQPKRVRQAVEALNAAFG